MLCLGRSQDIEHPHTLDGSVSVIWRLAVENGVQGEQYIEMEGIGRANTGGTSKNGFTSSIRS